jgi:hypothetical protein
MAELLDRRGSVEPCYKSLTGQRHYFPEMLGSAPGAEPSAISFDAIEKMEEPYRIGHLLPVTITKLEPLYGLE